MLLDGVEPAGLYPGGLFPGHPADAADNDPVGGGSQAGRNRGGDNGRIGGGILCWGFGDLQREGGRGGCRLSLALGQPPMARVEHLRDGEQDKEHKAGHEEMEQRKAEVVRIVSELESLDIIESVYSFIIGILSVKKGGAK